VNKFEEIISFAPLPQGIEICDGILKKKVMTSKPLQQELLSNLHKSSGL